MRHSSAQTFQNSRFFQSEAVVFRSSYNANSRVVLKYPQMSGVLSNTFILYSSVQVAHSWSVKFNFGISLLETLLTIVIVAHAQRLITYIGSSQMIYVIQGIWDPSSHIYSLVLIFISSIIIYPFLNLIILPDVRRDLIRTASNHINYLPHSPTTNIIFYTCTSSIIILMVYITRERSPKPRVEVDAEKNWIEFLWNSILYEYSLR
jgi:hypothetical protein